MGGPIINNIYVVLPGIQFCFLVFMLKDFSIEFKQSCDFLSLNVWLLIGYADDIPVFITTARNTDNEKWKLNIGFGAAWRKSGRGNMADEQHIPLEVDIDVLGTVIMTIFCINTYSEWEV